MKSSDVVLSFCRLCNICCELEMAIMLVTKMNLKVQVEEGREMK